MKRDSTTDGWVIFVTNYFVRFILSIVRTTVVYSMCSAAGVTSRHVQCSFVHLVELHTCVYNRLLSLHRVHVAEHPCVRSTRRETAFVFVVRGQREKDVDVYYSIEYIERKRVRIQNTVTCRHSAGCQTTSKSAGKTASPTKGSIHFDFVSKKGSQIN